MFFFVFSKCDEIYLVHEAKSEYAMVRVNGLFFVGVQKKILIFFHAWY